MKTAELIRLMAEDRQPPVRLPRRVLAAIAAGGLISVLLFLVTIGLRPGLGAALANWRVELKITATALMALFSLRLAFSAGIPGEQWSRRALWLILPVGLIVGGIMADLVILPSAEWQAAWLGRHAAFCVFFIPVLSLSPLVLLIAALRQGAPDHPMVAGALAGLAAGCLGAAIYAWHCPDDSPLFVTWYMLGISFSTAAGALAGHRMLRW